MRRFRSEPAGDRRIVVIQRRLTDYRYDFFCDLQAFIRCDVIAVFGEDDQRESLKTPNATSRAVAAVQVESRTVLRNIVIQKGVWETIQKLRPTTIVLAANPRMLSNFWILVRAFTSGVPVLLWGLGRGVPRDSTFGRLSRRFGLVVLACYLRLSAGVLAYGASAAADYAMLGPKHLKIWIAPNATRPEPRDLLPATTTHDNQPVRFLYLGKLSPSKGADALLLAWASSGLDSQAALTIAGDGPELPRLQSLATRLEFNSVSFTGRIDRTNLSGVFSGHDWYVMPGTGGLGAVDALSNGVPVISIKDVSGDGTLADILVDRQNALIASSLEDLPKIMLLASCLDRRTFMAMRECAKTSVKSRYGEMLRAFSTAIRFVESNSVS